MTDSKMHGHIKIDKLRLPNQLLSDVVKVSTDLTTLSMFVKLHFFSKSGVIKFNSVKEACDWFGISNSTYYKIRNTEVFKELFEVKKGYFKAKSLKKSRHWVGLTIDLNGRLKTPSDYRLGIDTTEESFNSIQRIKDVLRSALLVSMISDTNVKCEDGDREEKNTKTIKIEQDPVSDIGKRVSVARIDDNMKPIAYFSESIGCSDTKTKELLHSLRDEGYIGIQSVKKVVHESSIKEVMEKYGYDLYDVLKAANEWNFEHTYGKTAMPYFGVFVTQLPNRYWIEQKRKVVMPDGSIRQYKKHAKIIHVPDILWMPEYGTKEEGRKSKSKKKNFVKIDKKTLEDGSRQVEEIIANIRKQAKIREDGFVKFRDKIITKEEFEESVKWLTERNLKVSKENAKKPFEKGKVYKSKAPKSKLKDEVVHINYKELSTSWIPVPKDKYGYPNYSLVSKNVERYDRYRNLPEVERNHLDAHPEIDIATEEGRQKMKNNFKAMKTWNVCERMKKRYDYIKWVTVDAKWWNEEESTRIVKKFIDAYDYFKESGRGLSRRIAIAEKVSTDSYIEDVRMAQAVISDKKYMEAVDEYEKGNYEIATLLFEESEKKAYVQVDKKQITECLADDEERLLIDNDVVLGSYLGEVLMMHHTKNPLEGTQAGQMLEDWRKQVESDRIRKKDERLRRKMEKQEKSRNKKRRKEVLEETE